MCFFIFGGKWFSMGCFFFILLIVYCLEVVDGVCVSGDLCGWDDIRGVLYFC